MEQDSSVLLEGSGKINSPVLESDVPTKSDPVLIEMPKRDRFHFVSVKDMCAEPKPTVWLIKSMLEAGSLSCTFGAPESMKTFLDIDKGLCIATGRAWHGHPVCKEGPVFYIAGEGSSGIGRRIRAWLIENEMDDEDVPFFVSNRAAAFLDKAGAAEVVGAMDDLAEEYGEPVLVIIDTLNRNFGPGNELDTSDMTRFIGVISHSLMSRYGCAVEIIHHSGWDNQDRMRGASALRAALDWEYKVEKKSGIVVLTNTKTKDFEPPPVMYFTHAIIELDGWIDPDDGKVMTSCVLRAVGVDEHDSKEKNPLTGVKKVTYDALLSVMQDSLAGRVHIKEWREAAYKTGIYKVKTDEAKKKAFQRAYEYLQKQGYVDNDGDYWWPKGDTGQGQDNSGTCLGTK